MASLEASLFGQINSQETLFKLLNRLKAIGSEASEFSIHESVYKPREGSCIPPPAPSMKPVSLRLQNDQINNEHFIAYYGVPEVNSNRKCTVLPIIRSRVFSGNCSQVLVDLSLELDYELICKGYESVLGPNNELFLKIYQLFQIPSKGALESAYPIENGLWIIQLGSLCENVQVLGDRDVLLHEIGKIFDDLFELKHLENRFFSL